jgi:DNA-binding transcriptional LysR family regulator
MADPSDPSNTPQPLARSPHWHHITLAQFKRLKEWRELQRAAHPVECQIWEAVLTAWMMGWIGWLPAYVFEAPWAYPLCVLGLLAPRMYVYARARAHVCAASQV